MIRISQRDKRWKDLKIGKSNITIGQSGCALTSACMLTSKFYPIGYTTPDVATKNWTFVATENDPIPENLYWAKTDFKQMEFEWRQDGYDTGKEIKDPETGKMVLTIDLLKYYLRSPYHGVLFRVLNDNNGQHWLAGWDWGIFGQPVCHDPWDGTLLYKPWGFMGKYSRCTGFVIFQKK